WKLRRLMPVAASIVLTTLGLAAFMAYLWGRTADPLAFLHIKVTWGTRFVFPGWLLMTYFKEPYLVSYYGWDLGIINFPIGFLCLIIGAAWIAYGRMKGFSNRPTKGALDNGTTQVPAQSPWSYAHVGIGLYT